MLPRAPVKGTTSINYHLKSEAYNTLLCPPFSTRYIASWKHPYNLSSHNEKYKWCQAHQLSSEKWSIHYASLSTIFNSLHSNTNQNLVKKHLCSHYEGYGWFYYACEGSYHMQPPNQHYSPSAKMKRRTLVSSWRMHCVYCGMPRGTSWVEATSNNEKKSSS